jgi:hypothetical protein
LCNVCTKETIRGILDSSKKELYPVTFILGGKSPDLESQIKTVNPEVIIYVDSLNRLEKFNLSFLKNLKINTCNRAIKEWRFI